jgi:ribonucleoside-diphosphate reductase alpha chain
MAILRVDHPDVGRFAVSKRIEGEFSNFNISVGYTDEFVDAVNHGESYTLYDPTEDYEEPYTVREETAKFYNPEYANNPEDAYDDGEGAIVDENLWRDYADAIVTTDGETLSDKWEDNISLEEGEAMELPAEFLWDIMIDGAHANGEPGLFYLDETNREHTFDADEYPKHEINATNPCAEQPLSEYEACNLGHINLSLILGEDATTLDEFKKATHHRSPHSQVVEEYFQNAVDFSQLDRTIEAGVRFLDNVVTQSDFPIEEIEERVSNQRKIGLGIMGFAQMLYQMGIPYGSDDSYEMARCVMRYIDRKGTYASHSLAKDRGNFDYWDESKFANPLDYPDWFERHTGLPAIDYPDGYDIRNHNITTIAPTGTTSMIGNTSGGCEPVYNVANFKNVGNDIQGDDVLVEFDNYFLEALEANGIDVEAVKENAESLMRSNDFDGVDDLDIPSELKEIFVTTQDLSSEQHGLMQRAFQEFCDSGISKTVNMPNDASRQDVADAYMLAFDDTALGAPIKGLTVYRDGSRNEQVLTTRMDNGLDEEETDEQLLDLYTQGQISDSAAVELGIVESEGAGVDCPEDDCDGTLIPSDDCSVCNECFYSPCS